MRAAYAPSGVCSGCALSEIVNLRHAARLAGFFHSLESDAMQCFPGSRLIRSILLAAALAATAAVAPALRAQPASLESIETLLALTKAESIIEASYQQAEQIMRQTIFQELGRAPTPEEQQAFESFTVKFMESRSSGAAEGRLTRYRHGPMNGRRSGLTRRRIRPGNAARARVGYIATSRSVPSRLRRPTCPLSCEPH